MANQQMVSKQKPFLPPYSLLPTPYSLLPPLGYLLISLVATWPLVTHLRGWAPGIGDWGQNMWALWWTRQALLGLARPPFFTNYLFYPEGVTLLFHPLDVSDGLLAMPLYGLLGGDVTYNLMVLLSFVLGGWGTYLLALYLTGNRGASFVAGLIFVLSPYHFLRIDLGHLNLSSLQWIPFYALFLFKFVRQGSKRPAALAVLFLVLNALSSWYYVVYCGLISLAVLFWSVGKFPMGHSTNGPPSAIHHSPFTIHHSFLRPSLTHLVRIAVILATAMFVLSPLLLPMFRFLGATTLVGAHNPLRHSVDTLSFWVPGPPSTWANWFEEVWISYAAQNREPGASAYVGYMVLGLSVIGLLGRRWRRQALWWLLVALGFTLLALGPQLQFDGQIVGVSLPYQWLATIVPIFSITGIPGRFVVMTSLALAILAAYGVDTLVNWLQQRSSFVICHLSSVTQHATLQLRSRQTRNTQPFNYVQDRHATPVTLRSSFIIYILAALLITLEYLSIPFRLTSTRLPDFYHIVASEQIFYSMLDIKWDANYLMHAQTVHGKPLVGGWLARLPERQAAYLDQEGLDNVFLYLLLGPEGTNLTDSDAIQVAVQEELAKRNTRYIIDHNQTAGVWLEQFVGWPVVYQGDGIVVYGKSKIQ